MDSNRLKHKHQFPSKKAEKRWVTQVCIGFHTSNEEGWIRAWVSLSYCISFSINGWISPLEQTFLDVWTWHFEPPCLTYIFKCLISMFISKLQYLSWKRICLHAPPPPPPFIGPKVDTLNVKHKNSMKWIFFWFLSNSLK